MRGSARVTIESGGDGTLRLEKEKRERGDREI